MFSFAIRIVFFEIFIAFDKLFKSSSIITTSAASIAASLPIAPIATPTSAYASDGASFMPSPTKRSFLPFGTSFFSFDTYLTLSCGKSPQCISSAPTAFPTLSPVSFLSPVRSTVFLTPLSLRSETARGASGLSLSSMIMLPIYFPFSETFTSVPTESCEGSGILRYENSFAFPTAILLPSMSAVIPIPESSLKFFISEVSRSSPLAFLRACATGWLL